MSAFVFNTTRSLLSELGASERIGDFCNTLGIKRPLVISDSGIAEAGLLAPFLNHFEDAGLSVTCFDQVVADPPDTVVQAALSVSRAANCDGVIGFGGGSSLDTAKLVALLAGSHQPLEAVYGVEQAHGPRLPLILIPTTAGTGSEVTAVAIVTTGQTTKSGVVSKHLYPDLAILDATLTLGLPPAIAAATGIDAMVHAIEAFTSARLKNPYSDMLAKQALRLLSANIASAVHDGDDIAAREQMLLGACLAGQAFANAPVAAVHALAYPLGGHYPISHGLSNSLVLPEVMRFNQCEVASLYAELAPILFPHVHFSANANTCSSALIEELERLIESLGLPMRLRDVNVPEADLGMLASDAMLQQRLLVNNPRHLNEADALAIYHGVY